MPFSRFLLGAALSMSLGSISLAHDELVVGRSASGKLKVEIAFPQPIVLPVAPVGFVGYAAGDPGYSSIFADEPLEDLFLLSPNSNIRFILVEKDPGIEVFNDTGSAFMPIGGSFFLGSPFFDSHPFWNIVSGSPGNSYTLTMKVHDTTSIYLDSDPYNVTFTPIPEPGAILTCSAATTFALTIRRRR